MADKQLMTHHYTSSEFVESCGAILFDLSDPQNHKVCLGKIVKADLWVLPKGRRNIGETRQDAAVRETFEETGYKCRLFPVTMPTRACALDAPSDVSDKPRVHRNITEPFMCTFRELPRNKGVKITWWFIAQVDMTETRGPGEEQFSAGFFPCQEAISQLSFEGDQHVLAKAIEILYETIRDETLADTGVDRQS